MVCEPIELRYAKGCTLGMMLARNLQGASQPALATLRLQTENALRVAYAGSTRAELRQMPPMDAYTAYYRQFGSTYHVVSQVESVAGGKGIPVALPPVAVMFMAELQNGALTAAHDGEALRAPLTFRQGDGTEGYTGLGGREVRTTPGDWLLADAVGVVSSILHGPDQRTAVTAETQTVLYVAYAPDGVAPALLEKHFASIRDMLAKVYG